ncbi:hypothetical protein [Streptomyces hydrogenans]|uniref:hypothetical protein n=1 Tax=Streptomyces hydrogenans TaxID=1873719 RepID=UPI00278C48F4|nr:hypothetical protein [Streptomyces hydrogenans]
MANPQLGSDRGVRGVALAMRHGVTATQLRDGISTHPSPSTAEDLNEALATLH